MSFTVTTKAGTNTGGASTSITLSITIPAGATIAVCCLGNPEGNVASNLVGTLTDNNSVAYTAAPNYYSTGNFVIIGVSFYSINCAAATSLTWTPPTSTGGYYYMYMAAWVLTPTAGTVTNSGGASTLIQTDNTTPNSVTAGNCTITSIDAIVLGLANPQTTTTLSAGTVPTMVSDGSLNGGNAVYAHAAISSGVASPATWTDSTGAQSVAITSLAFSNAIPDTLTGQAIL